MLFSSINQNLCIHKEGGEKGKVEKWGKGVIRGKEIMVKQCGSQPQKNKK